MTSDRTPTEREPRTDAGRNRAEFSESDTELAFERAMRGVCEHVRRKRGVGRDGGVVVESWDCDTCGDTLIDRAFDDPSHVVAAILNYSGEAAGAATETGGLDLLDDLKPYLRHELYPACNLTMMAESLKPGRHVCTCGLDTILARLSVHPDREDQ